MTGISAPWSRWSRQIGGLSLAALGLLTVGLLFPVWSNLVMAGLVAFLLAPLVEWFEGRLHGQRGLAIFGAYVTAAIGFVLIVLVLVPLVAASFDDVDWAAILADTKAWLTDVINGLGIDFEGETLSLDETLDTVAGAGAHLDLLGPAFSAGTSVIGGVFGLLAWISITFVMALYISGSSKRMSAAWRKQIPEGRKAEMNKLADSVHAQWSAYVNGQIRVMAIVGVLTAVVLWALGVPGALALGVIAGLLEVIPFLGPIIAAVPAVLIALVQGSNRFEMDNLLFALIVAVAFLGIQELEGDVITPRVQGESVMLAPLVILVGVLVGIELFGLIGGIIAVPVIASSREIVSYVYNRVIGREPFTEVPTVEEVPANGPETRHGG